MLTVGNDLREATNKLEIASCYLYEIDYSDAEQPMRFTTNKEDMVFDGDTYLAEAIKHSDLTHSSDGKVNDVTVTVGNVDRVIQKYIEDYDLIGRPVYIRQIFENVTEPLEAAFKIKSVKAKEDVATFVLSIGLDYFKMSVPGRLARARYCEWKFKDADCKYSGGDTTCDRTFKACKTKDNLINFGGFPGIMNDRIYI
jgi:phage-related protein